jgi:hypothetical protein
MLTTTTHSMTSTTTITIKKQEYFSKIMKRLKEVGATTDRTNFYV